MSSIAWHLRLRSSMAPVGSICRSPQPRRQLHEEFAAKYAYPAVNPPDDDESQGRCKVYLLEGKQDWDNLIGNWPMANRDMTSVLPFRRIHVPPGQDVTENRHRRNLYGGQQLSDRYVTLANGISIAVPNHLRGRSATIETRMDCRTFLRSQIPTGASGVIESKSVAPWESKIFGGYHLGE